MGFEALDVVFFLLFELYKQVFSLPNKLHKDLEKLYKIEVILYDFFPNFKGNLGVQNNQTRN